MTTYINHENSYSSSSVFLRDEYDFDDDNDDLEDERENEEQDESDEGMHCMNVEANIDIHMYPRNHFHDGFHVLVSDTEEASESEMGKPEEYTEMREQ